MANDTFIPEMQENAFEDMYTRGSNNPSMTANGTYVPGMHVNAPSDQQSASQSSVATPVNRDEAVVGFLYSVSRKGIGEYWPLHLGANTIGRSETCNICLKELTVSDKHAVINIKKLKTTDVLIASIRDEGSKNGMFLNEEELDYDNHSCKNGDIITVGSNYQFLLILINTSQYGLKIAEGFQAIPEKAMPKAALHSSFDSETVYKKKSHTIEGTVDLGGNSPFIEGGATRIL